MSNKNSDTNNDNTHNIPQYFEGNDDIRRTHYKFRDYDDFNNKNSIRTYISSIVEKNHNFSLSSQGPEEILKIYNCYVSNEDFSFDDDFDTINNFQCTISPTVNDKNNSENDDNNSENTELQSEDNYPLKMQSNNINILNDIKTENHADAREFLFSFFEILSSPFLSTKAFSLMMINGTGTKEATIQINQNNSEEYEETNNSNQDKILRQINANNYLDSILLDKFLSNVGSLEVFLDHYCTLISPFEAGTCETNKDLIESRILQIKGLTTIITCYPSLISRMSKIIKKFSPSLFSLLKQSDLSTAIEAFRCIVSIFNCKKNVIKKKTRRKWLPKLINSSTPESPLFPLIINFVTNQKMIKFELSTVAEKIIEKSTFAGNRKKNLTEQENVKEVDDYASCSELTPYDDSFSGICNLEVLTMLESILIEVSRRNKRSKKTLISIPEQSSNSEMDLIERDNITKASLNLIQSSDQQNAVDTENDQNVASIDFPSNDFQQTITFLFNVAIEDSIFGRAAIEIIRNILISFTQQSTKKNNFNDDNDSDDFNTSSSYNPKDRSDILIWSVFMIRKSIVMFAIAERFDNFTQFERRCRCIENLCTRICETNENGACISPYVITSIKNIVRSALLSKKRQLTRKKEKVYDDKEIHPASIAHLASLLDIDANNIDENDIDEKAKSFLSSITSELIESEELTQFVHFPFDEGIDDSLMEF
ncbi:hypothetical protein M9Y10_001730 [Tritrichomonas musculus]|uniref:Uncharacterized protein n=1 Tax=Tritrichomonas musculus TaxID=1915356 RepID=A0ABR2L7S0_9EUKA